MTVFENVYSEIAGQAREHAALNFFEAYKKDPDRRVVLYGAGGNCQFALYACTLFKSIHVDCICDSALQGGETRTYVYENASSGEVKETYQVISPEQLLDEYRDAFVCVTSWKYEEEIRASLIRFGFPEEQIFYLRSPFLITPEVFADNYLDGYRWAYEFFPDECSRQKVINRARMFLQGDACPADSLFQDGYMAFPGIHLADGEVYIDGGAYTGDTAREFTQAMKAAGKRYSHIYSFEPDSHNFKIAEKTLSIYDHVELVPKGLWSRPGVLRFISREGGDHIGSGLTTPVAGSDWTDGEAVLSVPVTSLDEFFREKPVEEWPTLIKMDIEGAEKEALLGATEVIRRKKPRLIICAYHKPEDIYELPQTILKIRDDYQLSLWQIGESFWDVILYAV